jgi:hypothetical protein
MRTTAIIHVVRHDCALRTCGGVIGDKSHVFYRATCKDCGAFKDEHIRVVLEEYWVRKHRHDCPQRPGATAHMSQPSPKADLSCANCGSIASECTDQDEGYAWWQCMECGMEWREP